jgi:cytochrome c
MGFSGIKKVDDRADVIAWLRTLNDNPVALPSEDEIKKAEAKVKAQEEANKPKPAEKKAEGDNGGKQASGKMSAEDIKKMIAAGDPKKGENDSRACHACHDFKKGGPNRVGPNLWGVVGRPVASHEGFNYSDALKNLGGKWTYEKLWHFIHGPREYVKGTRMTFSGIKDPKKRADLLAWLREQSDSPLPLK